MGKQKLPCYCIVCKGKKLLSSQSVVDKHQDLYGLCEQRVAELVQEARSREEQKGKKKQRLVVITSRMKHVCVSKKELHKAHALQTRKFEK